MIFDKFSLAILHFFESIFNAQFDQEFLGVFCVFLIDCTISLYDSILYQPI